MFTSREPAPQAMRPATPPPPQSVETIPTYNEATTGGPASPPRPQPIPSVPVDEPPAYAVLDASQTRFSIYHTFIYTPTGPAYQLSAPLDQRVPYFRLRRLRAREAQQHVSGAAPVAFDKSYMLYEAHDPPLLSNEIHVLGKRRTCLPGVVEMKYRLGKWRAVHVLRAGAKGREILTCKVGGGRLSRKHELEAVWKDAAGRVVATEKVEFTAQGGVVPAVELADDLDQTWRELLLMLWTTRLWVAFGVEKTMVLGDRMRLGMGYGVPGGPLFGSGMK